MPALVARRPWAAVVFLVIAGLLAGVGIRPPAARAANTHRALVVVDTGKQVFHRCVGFSTDTISGRQALDGANVQPVYSGYGGMGSAVCSLCGTGCPSNDCFCDPNRYWRYTRQRAGSQTVAYSSQGASSTTVHDGDIEHWSWFASGDHTPAAENIDQYCAPATESAPTAGSGGAPTAPSSGGRKAVATSAPQTVAAGSAGPASTTTAAASVSTTASTSTTDPGTLERAVGASSNRKASHTKSPSSGVPGAVGFVVALVALAAAFVLARRSRTRRGLRPPIGQQ